ncbi:MAG: hypothetical protein ACLRZ9_05870 [Eubacterium sp.]
MRIIKIGEKEYKLEFTFAAAEYKSIVQSMFNVMSGAYIVKNGNVDDDNSAMKAMFDGAGEMVAEIPHIAKDAFYAGLLEHNTITKEQSNELLKQYMVENKMSFRKVFEDIKKYMEEDGFFDLSGLNEIIKEMNQTTEEETKTVKTPQDHKKKSTSTK